jgi:hypothetical protein
MPGTSDNRRERLEGNPFGGARLPYDRSSSQRFSTFDKHGDAVPKSVPSRGICRPTGSSCNVLGSARQRIGLEDAVCREKLRSSRRGLGYKGASPHQGPGFAGALP